MASKGRRRGKQQHRKDGPANLPESPATDLSMDEQISASLAVESMLRVLHTMMEQREFETPQQLNAFLEDISEEDFRRAREALMESNPREAAQQLAYQAMLDSENEQQAAAVARRALELDPACLDAKVILAELDAGDRVHAFVRAMEEIVAEARDALGTALDERRNGRPDGLETRPFLRALFRLAEAQRVFGNPPDAIACLQELLDLDPHDHQRAREPLLACYLATEDVYGAQRLLRHHASDRSAVFHWARVLERYLADDQKGALAALGRARRQNPHVELLITFRKAPPEMNPDAYLPGTEEEAVHCLYILGLAWANYPEAIYWVRAN
jgi:tetratricopeptide (TPR) repeat protein